MGIDESKIEREAQLLRSFMNVGQYGDLHEAEAVIERLRLDLMLNDFDGSAKAFYRAALHFLEESVELRHALENRSRLETRRRVSKYVHDLLDRLRGQASSLS